MPIGVEGPAGNIECWWSACDGSTSTGLICHPHPLYGGTMYDAVVAAVAEAMADCHVSTLRFNFRGVGASAGSHDKGEGEAVDVNFLIDWVSETRGVPVRYLAGYSFGALVALNAACVCQGELDHLFLVAPPLGFQPTPTNVPCPVTAIAGDCDQVIDQGVLNDWVQSTGSEQGYHVIAGADHFFSGCHEELRNLVGTTLRQLEGSKGSGHGDSR